MAGSGHFGYRNLISDFRTLLLILAIKKVSDPSMKSIVSTLDKQRICVNTQLKSSKKQLKLNVCVPKSNSVDRYAITCDVIAYRFPFV